MRSPCYGTLSFNTDGSLAYTPNPDFRGVDSFVYQASDGRLESHPATVTIYVGVPPIAVDDTYEVPEDTTLIVEAPGVLANDDTSSGPLEALLVDGPTNGTVSLNTDGSFTYTPNTDFSGIDTFVYSAFLPIEKEGDQDSISALEEHR